MHLLMVGFMGRIDAENDPMREDKKMTAHFVPQRQAVISTKTI